MNVERRTLNATRPDDNLNRLSPEDLGRVVRWVEDRMINAITPLDVRLQMEMPGTMAADVTLQTAQRAVAKVMAAVGEIRALWERGRTPTGMGAASKGPRTIDHGPSSVVDRRSSPLEKT